MLNLVKVLLSAVLVAIILTMLPVQSQAKQITHHAQHKVFKHKVLKHKKYHMRVHKHYSTRQSVPSTQSYWLDERARQESAGRAVPNDPVAIARRFLNQRNPTGFRGPWCGAFLGLVARIGGYFVPHGYLKASEWLHAGQRLAVPEYGALAVWRNHVGIVQQWPQIISGNFGHKVAEGIQRRQKLLGFVRLRKL